MTASPQTGRGPTIALAALILLTVAALVLTGQGVVGWVLSNQDIAEAEPATVAVETGPVIDQVSAAVTVEPAWASTITNRLSGAVFTRDGASPGQEIGAGSAIATIAERPLFVLPGSTPAYRSMGRGDDGPDVKQLQLALVGLGYEVWNTDGVFDIGTSRAVFAFYEDRGYQPALPSGAVTDGDWLAGAPFGEIIFAPSFPVISQSTCGVRGETPEADVCELAGGDPQLAMRLPSSETARLTAEQAVYVDIGGVTLEARLGRVLREERGGSSDEQSVSALAATVYLLEPAEEANLQLGDVGTAHVPIAASADTALRIASSALREDADGSTWLTTPKGERIPVDVGLCAAGFCEVSGPDIEPGLVVELPEL